jgi:hypothetical protein
MKRNIRRYLNKNKSFGRITSLNLMKKGRVLNLIEVNFFWKRERKSSRNNLKALMIFS